MSDDRTITCSECGTNLGDLPEGRPCPSCRSTRRNISVTVHPASIQLAAGVGRAHVRSTAIGTAVEHDTAMPITPLSGQPAGRTVVKPTAIHLEWLRPPEMWIVLAWLGDDLIGMGIGSTRRRALFAISHDIGDALPPEED